MNETIKQLLNTNKISQYEYDILFCNKFKFQKDSKGQIYFDHTLKKIIELQKDDWILDLSYIFFSHFTLKKSDIYEHQTISFNDAQFFHETVFDGINFKNDVNFIGTIFYGVVGFNMTIFSKKAYFLSTIFTQKVSFMRF